MGKKSIEDPPELQDSNQDSDYLTPSETVGVTQLDRYERLMEALLQLKNQKQMMPQTADRLLWLHSGWREEDKDKYLREVIFSISDSHTLIFDPSFILRVLCHVFLHFITALQMSDLLLLALKLQYNDST